MQMQFATAANALLDTIRALTRAAQALVRERLQCALITGFAVATDPAL